MENNMKPRNTQSFRVDVVCLYIAALLQSDRLQGGL